MSAEPLISIVMPARNAASFIGEAIASVLAQTWSNWELIVIDNGSTDDTVAHVLSQSDARIRLLHQPLKGVGHARNLGLQHITGSFYCFLDADDILPRDSLGARAALLLADPAIHFADGGIQAFAPDGVVLWNRSPNFNGDAFPELLLLNSSCFLGNTWMIRRVPGEIPLFRTDMTHAEDLYYYLCIAKQGQYASLQRPVLHYRRSICSAMTDLDGLHRGYRQLFQAMGAFSPAPSAFLLEDAWRKVRRIMMRSYAKNWRPFDALKAWLEPRPR